MIIQGAQQANEKLFNVINYQRNANQNHNEVSRHTGQNGQHYRYLQTLSAIQGVEKNEHYCTVGENVN